MRPYEWIEVGTQSCMRKVACETKPEGGKDPGSGWQGCHGCVQ